MLYLLDHWLVKLLTFSLVFAENHQHFLAPLISRITKTQFFAVKLAEVVSSRTQFEGLGLEGHILGLGFEASSSPKLACPRLENSTIFIVVKSLWGAWKNFWETIFSGDRLKNFSEDLFFGEQLRLCPWSLASSFVSSTPPLKT